MASKFITSVADPKMLPTEPIEEVAFVGRSNVGKSTLLNQLLGVKALARVSRTPGRTQLINYFLRTDGDSVLHIVDLPGYGFSATGKSARADWQELMSVYFERPQLRNVIFLLDARREPDEDDLHLIDYLRRNCTLVLVFTKLDQLNQSQKSALNKKLQHYSSMAAEVFCVTIKDPRTIEAVRDFVFAK